MKLKQIIALCCIALILASITFVACNALKDTKNTETPTGFTADTDEKIANMIPDYNKYVTLGDYSNMTYEIDGDFEVTDEDVQYGLINALKDITVETEVKDRPSQKGDTVNISYKGTIDGKPFKGSDTDENGKTILLGHESLVGDFEEKITGMKTGETKTIEITYPKDYGNDARNGKTATFKVTMNKISTRTLPELTDKLVKENSEFNSVKEITDACKAALTENKTRDKRNATYDAILNELISISEYHGLPKEEMDELINESIKSIEDYAKSSNTDVITAIKDSYGVDTMDECKKLLTAQATDFFTTKVTLCTLARQESIKITVDEFEAYKKTMVTNNKLSSTEDLLGYYDEQDLVFDCLLKKIQTWLLENIKEKKS